MERAVVCDRTLDCSFVRVRREISTSRRSVTFAILSLLGIIPLRSPPRLGPGACRPVGGDTHARLVLPPFGLTPEMPGVALRPLVSLPSPNLGCPIADTGS